LVGGCLSNPDHDDFEILNANVYGGLGYDQVKTMNITNFPTYQTGKFPFHVQTNHDQQ
jgi:hypothetical protein